MNAIADCGSWRDHLGVKPLFYSIQHGQLSFASEVSALWRNPALSREVDFGGLDAFMTFSYVPAPLTGYKDVRQLLPGEWLLAEAGRIQHRKYWDVSLDAPKFRESEEELEEAFGDLFRRVVKRQMIADVPVGCYLSGGIDSFAVARAMHGVNGDKTQAFSMGFREPSFDEAPLAKIAADTLGVGFPLRLCRAREPGASPGDCRSRSRAFRRLLDACRLWAFGAHAKTRESSFIRRRCGRDSRRLPHLSRESGRSLVSFTARPRSQTSHPVPGSGHAGIGAQIRHEPDLESIRLWSQPGQVAGPRLVARHLHERDQEKNLQP